MIANHQQLIKGTGITIAEASKAPILFEGVTKLASFNPDFSCCEDYSNGKFYSGLMGRIDNQRDPWILKIDKAKNKIEQVHRIQIGVSPLNGDTHRGPIVDVDQTTGHVYVVCERLSATEGHGTDVLVYKTTVAGNISTLTLINTLTGSWTYPFVKVSGNNVFVSARGIGTASFVRGQQWYWNSTDGGTTFGAAVKLYDSDSETTEVAYIFEQANYDGGISFVLNLRNNDTPNWTSVSFITGTWNSDVWSNGRGFTKDVSGGYITTTQMLNEYLVLLSPNLLTIAVNHEGGATKSDGSIRMLITLQTLTGNTFEGNPETEVDELRFYYLSGGTWLYNVIDIPTGWAFYWGFHRYITYFNNDEADRDAVCFINPTSNNDVTIITSDDNFVTQESRVLLVGNGNYRQHKISFNSLNSDESLVVIVDTIGDMFEFSAETVFDYSNIIAIQ